MCVIFIVLSMVSSRLQGLGIVSCEITCNTLDALAQRFSFKDPEDLYYFLGIEARRVPSGLNLSQRKYIIDLLTRTNMLASKPVSTPIVSSPTLTWYFGTR